MSERTTIGGTVYETIGSSNSNLLLKCNGTARIQWGGKLIDLIKNGKIASETSQEFVFNINDESEMKSDGIYILPTEESYQIIIYKDGNKYDFTSSNLYILANDKQELSNIQKQQALENIGLYYNTLEDVKNAEITQGIVYVLQTKTLYTIQEGIIEELKTISKNNLEENTNNENQVNSSDKIESPTIDTNQESTVYHRGMIVMHYGIEPVPKDWAVCDGNEYTFNGVTTKTPNLSFHFIQSNDDSNININGNYYSLIFIMKL